MESGHHETVEQGSLPGAFRLGYPILRGPWDEMVDPDGWLRPHWNGFIEGLSGLAVGEVSRRWDRGQRLIRENGVTYNVYRDPRGLDRPWQLDPVPMILSAPEWRSIEQGLIQRATVLNRVLADLYGKRQLLRDGLLPPALLFANPGFLRPLDGVAPAGGVHLHLYAADLARSPDGQWWVMSDRCEAPSGAGYALENRTIIARTLGDLMRRTPAESLSPFFQKLRETLYGLSPRHHDIPRIVLLTPGPYNETFFEHAYLARFLGYTLVEAEDLTVRDDHVFLKTLDGLQPVDVILRRTDGAYCDPLELKGDSALGVAGLVQAVRRGNVVIANGLGSGLLDGGTLAPFLPVLTKRLLGEKLALPSVASWWCGTAADRGHVLANLDRMVIRRLRGPRHPIFGDQLDEPARATLAGDILDRPQAFVAQERVRLSTAPVWIAGQLDPRPLMVRVFVAAHDGGYVAMPGGLTRIAAERDGKIVSMQSGGGSKDTWILADDRRRQVQTIRSTEPAVRLMRGTHDLPSRVADNLFWFGRYVERTEDTTRLLRAAASRIGNTAGFGALAEMPAAIALLSYLAPAPDLGKKENAGLEEIIQAILRRHRDPKYGPGLRATVERVHRMAAMARDRLSLDTWRAVNRLYDELAALDGADPAPEDATAALNGVVLACEALNGLAMENMTRGLAWRFVDIGRRLERGLHVIDSLSNILKIDEDGMGAALDVLLEVSDSAMTYRSRYLSAPQFAPVLDLLLADESNPRSLAFQNAALGTHMDQIAIGRRLAFFGPEQRQTIWLTGAVRTADIAVLSSRDDDGGRRNLAAFLEVLRSKLWELSETLTREYFTHAIGRNPAGRGVLTELTP